jgi:hypothetical protein
VLIYGYKEGVVSMTMKMDREFTIKMRKHPSAPRYPGRANQELGAAITKFLSLLDVIEREQFADRSLIVDEDDTATEFDSVLSGDTIGIALEFEDGYISTQVKVDNVTGDIIYGQDIFTEDDIEITFEEISVARAMGYFEILYRPDADGKNVPYGVDTDLKVKVMVEAEEVTVENNVSGSVDAPDSSQEPDPNLEGVMGAATDPEALKALLKAQQDS